MTYLDVPVVLIQIALPFLLLAAMVLRPSPSAIGFAIQAIASGSILLAVLLVPIWMVPPWWTPYAYGALWFFIVLANLIKRHNQARSGCPRTATQWIMLTAYVVAAAYAISVSVDALQGRQPGDMAIVDLPFPLGEGTYLIANGGSREIINGHMMTLHPETARQRAYRGQSLGIDIVKIDRIGLRARGWRPRRPERYEIFGEKVYAPCAGNVTSAQATRPDMPVPDPDRVQLEGNHVLVQCEHFSVLLAHLRQGSVTLRVGDAVAAGDVLGEVGNSGQSFEPHLHIHAQRSVSDETPFAGEPLQLRLDGRFFVRNAHYRKRLKVASR